MDLFVTASHQELERQMHAINESNGIFCEKCIKTIFASTIGFLSLEEMQNFVMRFQLNRIFEHYFFHLFKFQIASSL